MGRVLLLFCFNILQSIKRVLCLHKYKQIGTMTVGFGSEDCTVGKIYCCDKCKKRRFREVKFYWKNGCELVGNKRVLRTNVDAQVRLRGHCIADDVQIIRVDGNYIELRFSDGTVGQFSFGYIEELVVW